MAGLSLRLVLGAAVGLTIQSPISASADSEKDQRTVMELFADVSAGPSRRIAVGMSSLANLRTDMADINIDWVVLERSIGGVLKTSSDLALLDLGKVDIAAIEDQTDLRAVMTFWPEGGAANEKDDAHPGYLLAARSTVSPDFIDGFLSAVEDDVETLEAAQIDIEKLDPSIAMADLPIALHEGANQYYLTSSADDLRTLVKASDVVEIPLASEALLDQPLEPAQTPIPETVPVSVAEKGGRSFTLYFGTDEAKLDRNDIKMVADACRYASTLTSARFVITGHTDTVGSMDYNADLAERRALATANAIKNDPRFREALSVIEHGESMLAIKTDDEVSEPKNRRVEITIIEGS